MQEEHKRLKREMQLKLEENKLCVRRRLRAPLRPLRDAALTRRPCPIARSLGVRLAQSEEAAKRAALASYGGQRAPPGAAKLYEAEQVRPSLFGVARCAVPARAAASRAATPPQRIAELSATVADLRRKLAKEREACAAAQRETKARARPQRLTAIRAAPSSDFRRVGFACAGDQGGACDGAARGARGPRGAERRR